MQKWKRLKNAREGFQTYDEKDGVISINKEASSSYQNLNEEYENLKAEKDQIITKDNTLSKKYNQFLKR